MAFQNIKKLTLLAVVGFCLTSQAWAQSFSPLDHIRLDELILPTSTGAAGIDADGTIVVGAQNFLFPGNVREGRYRINGTSGTIDIGVTATSTCDGVVTFSRFPALWRGSHYADIMGSPIVGAVFTDGDILEIGAHLNYTPSAPAGVCASSMDLTITVY